MSKNKSENTKIEIKNFEEYEKATREGAELFNAGKYEEALGVFLAMVAYHPNNYKIYETLATIYLKTGDADEAARRLEQAYAILGKEKEIVIQMRDLKEVVAELDDLETLEKEYHASIENPQKSDDPAPVRLPIQMGLHYMATGDYKKAEELLTQHLERYQNSKN